MMMLAKQLITTNSKTKKKRIWLLAKKPKMVYMTKNYYLH